MKAYRLKSYPNPSAHRSTLRANRDITLCVNKLSICETTGTLLTIKTPRVEISIHLDTSSLKYKPSIRIQVQL